MAEFDACVVGGELPADLTLFGVDGVLPGGEFGCAAFAGQSGVQTEGEGARGVPQLPLPIVLGVTVHSPPYTNADLGEW